MAVIPNTDMINSRDNSTTRKPEYKKHVNKSTKKKHHNIEEIDISVKVIEELNDSTKLTEESIEDSKRICNPKAKIITGKITRRKDDNDADKGMQRNNACVKTVKQSNQLLKKMTGQNSAVKKTTKTIQRTKSEIVNNCSFSKNSDSDSDDDRLNKSEIIRTKKINLSKVKNTEETKEGNNKTHKLRKNASKKEENFGIETNSKIKKASCRSARKEPKYNLTLRKPEGENSKLIMHKTVNSASASSLKKEENFIGKNKTIVEKYKKNNKEKNILNNSAGKPYIHI